MRLTKKLTNIDNVVAGGTCIIHVPVGGPTVDNITLFLSNITSAQLDNIRVKLNGKEIQFYEDAALLQDINDFYGRPANTNEYQLCFARPEMVDLAQERLTGIGTANLQTFTIEADIDAGAASPAISAWAQYSDPAQVGLITKVKRFVYNAGAAGQFECDSIILGPRIGAMHFQKADVDNMRIEVGGVAVMDDITKLALESVQDLYGRTPQNASFTHVDFMLEGDHAQAMVTSQRGDDGIARNKEIRFLPTLGTSGAMDVYVEYLDGFAGV